MLEVHYPHKLKVDNLLKEYDNLTINIKNHLSKIGSLKGFNESEYIRN